MSNTPIIEARLKLLQGFIVFGLCLVITFAITITAVMTWQMERNSETAATVSRLATETHTVLCETRRNLEARIETTEKYLQQHKEPMILGIPRSVFVRALARDRRTLETYSVLNCDS